MLGQVRGPGELELDPGPKAEADRAEGAAAAAPPADAAPALPADASLATRIAASRQARSAVRRKKQRAPARPAGQPLFSMADAVKADAAKAEEERGKLMREYYSMLERG